MVSTYDFDNYQKKEYTTSSLISKPLKKNNFE